MIVKIKPFINIAITALIGAILTACATTKQNPSSGLRFSDYDIHTYQPPCYVTTTRHASGTILGQVTQCPPVQYYCTLKSTGSRITCPKFNKQQFDKEYAMLEDSHYKEDCRLVNESNRTRPRNEWHSILFPEKNPYCDKYGNPK